MRSDPSTRKSDALCEFHQERGHKTENCIALRQEVLNMLHQGHLKELLRDRGRTNFAQGREQHQGLPKPPSPTRTIQMIIGDGDDVSINSIKFATTHKLKRSITNERYDELEESIIFDKPDTHDLVFPHYDALIITLRILDTDVRHIMVDDGSGACIVHPRVLAQMKLEDNIVPCCIILTGFNNAVERTSWEITLPVLAGGVTLETIFHIMDQDTAYNAIIVRPWIHAMRVIPSSLYQVIKFPTPWGVFSIRGEQRTSRECYRIAHDYMPVREEVEKLLENGSIRESKYPQWVANVVMVKKKNGKWWMCIDFTDLNKACPKDSFPLPHIDQLIDATAGHELLSFLDAYSGYN
uniref:RNA-directed DNA polymerase homolog n=1 Tax=Nicotiana tabacum TaxID=4097 RepID=A0A1S4DNT6_TOBAC|nr:PREDICTED: uncharacterized protein LOC107831788 [Nicotiana tabacum]